MKVEKTERYVFECTREEALLIRNAITYRRTEGWGMKPLWTKAADTLFAEIEKAITSAVMESE